MNDGMPEIPAVALYNLRLIGEEQSLLSDARICELQSVVSAYVSFARFLLLSGIALRDVPTVLCESPLPQDIRTHADILPDDLPLVMKAADLLALSDRASFVSLLRDALLSEGITLCEADFLQEGRHILAPTIGIVPNPLANEAFDVFADRFPAARMRTFTGFDAMAQALTKEETDFCLLPFEERGGVRLSLAEELIRSRDLRVVSVTPVFGIDGTAGMKYALVGREFLIPPVRASDDRYLELLLSDTSVLSELLPLLSVFGATVDTVSTFAKGDGRREVDLVLRTEGGDFTLILLYLAMFIPDALAVGLYANLEE